MNTDNNVLFVLICALATFSASISPVAYSMDHVVTKMDEQKQQEICADAWPIGPNGSLRDFLSETGELRCYRVYVPRPGFVTAHVLVSGTTSPGTTSPGTTVVEPKLGFFSQHCISGKRSATSLILAIREPGQYYFCVTSQDPALPLGEFRLSARFVPHDVSEIFLSEKTLDDELVYESGVVETELDPDLGSGGKSRSFVYQELCQADEGDDHGDTSVCATPLVLGDDAGGQISNPWADDSDYFTFNITTRQTVRIRTSGDADTFGGLYDARGHRLATDDDGGVGGNFRIVTSLSAGRYFVRVEGHGGETGRYAIESEALSW